MLQSFQGGGDVNCAYGVGGGFKKVERRVSELFFFFFFFFFGWSVGISNNFL